MELNEILIVGNGSMGNRHASIAKNMLPKAKVTQIGSRFFEKNKTDSCFDLHPDIVVIANASSKHLETLEFFAALSNNFLIEKPLCDKWLTGIEFEVNHSTLFKNILVGYNLRFLQIMHVLQEIIYSGRIGRPITYHCEVGQQLSTWRPNKDYRESVSASRNLGGGVLLELSHEIDYLIDLFGPIESVIGKIGKYHQLEIDVEDTAQVILTNFSEFFNCKINGTLTMDFNRMGTERFLKVIGEKGSLFMDLVKQEIMLLEEHKSNWSLIYKSEEKMGDTYIKEWKYFIKHIKEGLPLEPSFSSALKVVKIVDAIKESSEQGRIVAIPSQNE